MDKEITISWKVPRCKCGVQGDILIQMTNAVFDHIWCSVCGYKFTEDDFKTNHNTNKG